MGRIKKQNTFEEEKTGDVLVNTLSIIHDRELGSGIN